MREIKCRAWDSVNQKINHSKEFCADKLKELPNDNSLTYSFGQVDYSGELIYELDIVRIIDDNENEVGKFLVVFDDYHLQYSLENFNKDNGISMLPLPFTHFKEKDIVIIGNALENIKTVPEEMIEEYKIVIQ